MSLRSPPVPRTHGFRPKRLSWRSLLLVLFVLYHDRPGDRDRAVLSIGPLGSNDMA